MWYVKESNQINNEESTVKEIEEQIQKNIELKRIEDEKRIEEEKKAYLFAENLKKEEIRKQEETRKQILKLQELQDELDKKKEYDLEGINF